MDAPIDKTLVAAVQKGQYDRSRTRYRCPDCYRKGEMRLHRYLDECPYFKGKG